MILTQKNITNAVRDYFKDKPVKSVYLFGSYARGDANEGSDVDLLIEINDEPKRLSLFDVLRLQVEISKALHKNVELIEQGLIFPRIKAEIEKEKIKIFSC